MNWLADFLRDTSVKNIDIDCDDRIHLHSSILLSKPMLKKVFTEFHQIFNRLDRQFFVGNGMRVEIGAGVAPIRNSYKDVLATDVVNSSGLDHVLNAENMDIKDNSVRVLFGQNCFHHFSNPKLFFEEVDRVVEPGGGVILLEPYYGPFASFLFGRMFPTEGYDKNFPLWETPEAGPMNGANQALSYIIFNRDKREFERLFPRLRIVHQEVCNNYLMYLFSGGLNFRQLWPNRANSVLVLVQKILNPFSCWLALHHVTVIRKEV